MKDAVGKSYFIGDRVRIPPVYKTDVNLLPVLALSFCEIDNSAVSNKYFGFRDAGSILAPAFPTG
jgi:hypothetical protein